MLLHMLVLIVLESLRVPLASLLKRTLTTTVEVVVGNEVVMLLVVVADTILSLFVFFLYASSSNSLNFQAVHCLLHCLYNNIGITLSRSK
jgi:hypothetical protein